MQAFRQIVSNKNNQIICKKQMKSCLFKIVFTAMSSYIWMRHAGEFQAVLGLV